MNLSTKYQKILQENKGKKVEFFDGSMKLEKGTIKDIDYVYGSFHYIVQVERKLYDYIVDPFAIIKIS